MSNKKLTLSIVIPAYNEQRYLKACLDSIARQVEMPDEVFVVDNNSTDNTGKIAKAYSFVTLLHEPNQHQSFAQATGFNAATSDILGRIDADCILPVDWTRRVKKHFAKQPGLSAITGSTTPYDISIGSAGTKVFRFYIDFASWLAGCRMLWGADCALRRRDWLKVKNQVMRRGDIWEDYDLAFCLAPHGQLKIVDDIDVASSFRAVHKSLFTQTRYQFRAVRTFYHHNSLPKTAIFMAVWCSMFFIYSLTLLDKYILKPIWGLFGDLQSQPKKAGEVVPLKAE